MSYSKVTICNKALGLLSASPLLTFDEDTNEGGLCRSQYEVVVRSVLEQHAWSFAIKRRVISRQASTPDFGYKFKFTKPSDCLRILRVSNSKERSIYSDDEFDWALEGGDILCDNSPIYLTYIYHNTTPDRYSSSFIDAVSLRLAAELAHALTESKNLYSILMNRYDISIRKASNADSMQGSSMDIGRKDFIRIR